MQLSSWLIILLVPTVTLLWFLFLVRRQTQKIAWLQRNGMRIGAIVVGVEERGRSDRVYRRASILATLTRDGEHSAGDEWECSYTLVAQWTDPLTQQSYTFSSELPRSWRRQYTSGCTVGVLVDFNHPRRYVMDLM